MKALVAFDTLYGNTQQIAGLITSELENVGIKADCENIKAIDISKLVDYDFIAIGGPTQFLAASKGMKEFLQRLSSLPLKGKLGFAFDTKLNSRLSGSAAKFIEKKMILVGFEVIRPRESAIVISSNTKGKETSAGGIVLANGMDEKFHEIGRDLATILTKEPHAVERT